MPAPNRHTDPVLARVASEMERLYGPRLRGLLLFGSRARGDHRPDSDCDVGVIVETVADYWAEIEKLAVVTSARGSIALFHEVAVAARKFDRSLAAFLAEGFEIKQSVDCEPIEPDIDVGHARRAIDRAERFITAAELLSRRITPDT